MKKQTKKVSKILEEAHARFKLALQSESENRDHALKDLRQYVGDQWPQDIKDARATEGRPAITINLLRKFVKQVTNQAIGAPPDVSVQPVGSGSDPALAEAYESMLRHIEDSSLAQHAYQHAFMQHVQTGLGYFQVKTKYCDDGSGNQEIAVATIPNRFSVYFDPFSTEPDGSDAKWAFRVYDLPEDEYKARYPRTELAGFNDFNGIGDQYPYWFQADGIRLAEYWVVRENIVIDPDTTAEHVEKSAHCYLLNAIEIIKEYDLPVTRLPIIPILGSVTWVGNKKVVEGLIRNAIEPQLQYNLMASAATESIALAPKAPFVAAEGQIENHEKEWEQANVKNFPVLQYKPVSAGGQPVPPPQRQATEPPIQAISQMLARSDGDLQSTTGLFDAALGITGPEQSGAAINARQGQGSISTLDYLQALQISVRAARQMMMDLIPVIYDAPRIERILNPDGAIETWMLFNGETSGLNEQQARQTFQQEEVSVIHKVLDVSSGRYHVRIPVGPSSQTKRREFVQAMTAFVNSYPQLMEVAGDKIFQSMDYPGAREIGARMAQMLPPPLQKGFNPAAMAQQLQVLTQQNQQLAAKLQSAEYQLLAKREQMEFQRQMKELSAQVQIIVQMIKSQTAQSQQAADHELALTEMWHQSAHEAALQQVQGQQQQQQVIAQQQNQGGM